jgi:hypothetical protein
MLSYFVSKLPVSTIRYVERLQFRFPILKSLISRISNHTVGEAEIIQRGIGSRNRSSARLANTHTEISTSCDGWSTLAGRNVCRVC